MQSSLAYGASFMEQTVTVNHPVTNCYNCVDAFEIRSRALFVRSPHGNCRVRCVNRDWASSLGFPIAAELKLTGLWVAHNELIEREYHSLIYFGPTAFGYNNTWVGRYYLS